MAQHETHEEWSMCLRYFGLVVGEQQVFNPDPWFLLSLPVPYYIFICLSMSIDFQTSDGFDSSTNTVRFNHRFQNTHDSDLNFDFDENGDIDFKIELNDPLLQNTFDSRGSLFSTLFYHFWYVRIQGIFRSMSLQYFHLFSHT